MLNLIYRGLRTRWRLLTRPDRVTMHGATLRVLPDMPYRVRRSFYAQSYEAEEAAILLQRLEPDDVVLECGGGIGYLSALIAKRLGDEAVVTFEANPELYEVILENHRLSGASPRVVNAALGTEDRDEVAFNIGESFAASSLIQLAEATREVHVPMVDINRAVREMDPAPNFLALDVEGFETELIPALDLSPFRKILLEVHPGLTGEASVRDLLKYLRTAGFELDEISSAEVWYLQRT